MTNTGPRSYETGIAELDSGLRELVGLAGDGPNRDLVLELMTTAVKLYRDGMERGDLKLVNTALKEMRYSMLVFSRHHEPKVTMFGSARLPESDPNYGLALTFAEAMAAHGWGVVTGAGPGIMEAGNRGAGLASSYGVKIRLPFESAPNGYVDPARTVNFKYFFTRKLGFVKESLAFALFPGGFGTLDETFELLTLVQTGKSDMHPIVMIDAEGSDYWDQVLGFVERTLVGGGFIGHDDLSLFTHTHDPLAAVEEIIRFYANYQSQRYVDGKLVLRLRQAPDSPRSTLLTEEFGDILTEGAIEVIGPTEAEIRDGDSVGIDRVALSFDRRHFGRLRQLIDRLNNLVVAPAEVHPPSPFGVDQAERSW